MHGLSLKRLSTSIGSIMCVAASIMAQAPAPPPGLIPPEDLLKAKNVVSTFCTDWKTMKFDSMYVMMSEATKADLPKPKFINTYGVMADNSRRLGSFVMKDAVPNEDEIVVKAELTFAKQNPPVATNGVHNFHLVNENGKWKIKTIVPPIQAPEASGSGGHPGE